MAKHHEPVPAVLDPDKELIPVPKEVYNFHRWKVLYRHILVEMAGNYRTQIVKSKYLEPMVKRLCMEFLESGDLTVTDEEVVNAKIDLQEKTLRIGKDLDIFWDDWYGLLCKTVRAYEDKLPTISY